MRDFWETPRYELEDTINEQVELITHLQEFVTKYKHLVDPTEFREWEERYAEL